MQQVAMFISRVFDPLVVLTVVTTLGAWVGGLRDWALYRFLLVLYGGMVLPPVILLAWAVRSRRLDDWDVSNRRQRLPVLVIGLLFVALDIWLVSFFDNQFLERLFLLYLVWFLGFLGLTLKWKISGHVSILTMSLGLAGTWFGWQTLPLWALVPLAGWARIATRKHTLGEVIGGALYSFVLLITYHLSRTAFL